MSIRFEPGAIDALMDELWTGFVGLDLRRTDAAAIGPEATMIGFVALGGAWHGGVALQCSRALAAAAAAAAFGIAPEAVGQREIDETMGELSNILAGNLKTFLPAPSTLSIPSIEHGGVPTRLVPHGQAVACADYLSGGRPLRVTVVESLPSA